MRRYVYLLLNIILFLSVAVYSFTKHLIISSGILRRADTEIPDQQQQQQQQHYVCELLNGMST